MPRKDQGWITFQSSDEERRILEQICQQTQRTKTEILREMIRQMGPSSPSAELDVNSIEFSEDLEGEG
ncbi:MAG TPA: transporter, partial [Planktothrix sp. UBA10369]|nr:transporter [Planktothrix sp. UBA10369]